MNALVHLCETEMKMNTLIDARERQRPTSETVKRMKTLVSARETKRKNALVYVRETPTPE